MKGLSVSSTYVDKKKSVIRYIEFIITSKSREDYVKNRKASLFNFCRGSLANKLFNWERYKWYTNRTQKTFPSIKTFSPTKINGDFLRAISSFESEIEEMEKHIDEILLKACNDEQILEECENYLTRVYKIHLARLPIIINLLILILFMGIALILVGLLGYFPVTGVTANDVNVQIINFTTSLLLSLTASITLTNATILILRPSVEGDHLYSTSAYEYWIEILKNARLRIKSSSKIHKNSKQRSRIASYRSRNYY